MKNILFVGKFYPMELLKTIAVDSKGKIGMSNHNFEMSIINGLCMHQDINLRCISVPGVYSWPHNNRRLYTKAESYNYKTARVSSVSFCNIVILKEFWSTMALAVEIVKSVASFDGERVDVIINTPDNRLLDALNWARRITKKRITQTVIIPDIPSMITSMDSHNFFKKLLLHRFNSRAMTKASKSNGLVLLTEAMLDFVSGSFMYKVMEGIVDIETMDYIEEGLVVGKEIILYTGTLREIFGVKNLVDAFRKISDSNIELWICGSGDSEEYIREAAAVDSRIKFWGLVDSKTALRMQCQATILVNPRTSHGEYTKYSFPSKTLEYLLSARSVIINRLPGIPDEYYKYVFTPENESVEALSHCIANVISMDKSIRYDRAVNGRRFILNWKNSKMQTANILEMISHYKN